MEYSIINMLKRINFLYMQNNFIHIHIEIFLSIIHLYLIRN